MAAKYKWNLRGGIRDILGGSIAFLRNSHILPVSYKFINVVIIFYLDRILKFVCALEYVNAKTFENYFQRYPALEMHLN